jgi:phosphatidate cytidylyltransferase
VFALLLVVLGIVGYREFLGLSARAVAPTSQTLVMVGSSAVAAFGLAGLLHVQEDGLFLVSALSVAVPLIVLFPRSMETGDFSRWSSACTGIFYLGLPVFAAVSLRGWPGSVDAGWFNDLANRLSLGSVLAPRGLAWALTVILCTWIGDSAAYLVGRSLGRRKLAPDLSPNKTVEGAAGGLLAATLTGSLVFAWSGLGSWWIGALAGAVIGIAGQLGDLGESLLKRQAGVKDSGAAIPGHGGILDRIDALLFAFPAGYLLAAGFDWLIST